MISQNRIAFQFVTLCYKFSNLVGRTIAWLTLTMMLLMTLVVILRYAFNVGSIAMQEGVMYLHAFVLMLGMATTLKNDQHVRVDIFYRRMSSKHKQSINVIGHCLFLIPTCIFILMMSWDYVLQSWQVSEGSQEAGGLPIVYLLKSLLFIMPLLLILQALAEVVEILANKFGPQQITQTTDKEA